MLRPQTAGGFLPVSVPVSSAANPGITISMPVLDSGGGGTPGPAAQPPAEPPPPPPPPASGEETAAPPVLHIPERSSTPDNLAPPPEADFSLNGSSSDVLMDVTLANSNSSFSGESPRLGGGGHSGQGWRVDRMWIVDRGGGWTGCGQGWRVDRMWIRYC